MDRWSGRVLVIVGQGLLVLLAILYLIDDWNTDPAVTCAPVIKRVPGSIDERVYTV